MDDNDNKPKISVEELASLHDRVASLAIEFRERGFEVLALPLFVVATFMAAGQLHKLLEYLAPTIQGFGLMLDMMGARDKAQHQAVRDFDVMTGRRPNTEALYATNDADPVAAGLHSEDKSETLPASQSSTSTEDEEWQTTLQVKG